MAKSRQRGDRATTRKLAHQHCTREKAAGIGRKQSSQAQGRLPMQIQDNPWSIGGIWKLAGATGEWRPALFHQKGHKMPPLLFYLRDNNFTPPKCFPPLFLALSWFWKAGWRKLWAGLQALHPENQAWPLPPFFSRPNRISCASLSSSFVQISLRRARAHCGIETVIRQPAAGFSEMPSSTFLSAGSRGFRQQTCPQCAASSLCKAVEGAQARQGDCGIPA